MKGVFGRSGTHSNNFAKVHQPSLDLHLELRKQMAEASLQIRHMRGEDLQGLTIQELQQLEKTLEFGLSRVMRRKDEQIMEQINEIRTKEIELMEENAWLRHQLEDIQVTRKQAVANPENAFQEDGQSSLSETNLTLSGSRENDDCSDVSLRLGLSCHARNK